jgi:hypothetical protein
LTERCYEQPNFLAELPENTVVDRHPVAEQAGICARRSSLVGQDIATKEPSNYVFSQFKTLRRNLYRNPYFALLGPRAACYRG